MIVCRIIDVLSRQARKEAFEEAGIVETLPGIFGPVVQIAVPDEKVESAAFQIESMDGRKTGHRQCAADDVMRPFPAYTGVSQTGAGKAIDGGEFERFGLAVIPAETHEDAQAVGDLLIRADAEAVFERAEARVLLISGVL